MKKRFLRAISLILICLMLLSVFISCGNKKPTDNTGETEADENPNIPAKDYGGYEFTFLAVKETGIGRNLDSDGENGEILNDAIYRRNELIEKKYNVKISVRLHALYYSFPSYVENEIKTGDKSFDAIIASGEDLAALAKDDYLYDLLTVDGFNFDASYWDKNAKEQLAIDGKLYFTNCALNLDNVGSVMFFNKKLIEDNGLTSPFEYMKNNEWTVDNWAKLARSVSKDIDNDGKITHLDQIGIAYDHSFIGEMLYGAGVRGTKLDKNGYPEVAFLQDKNKTEGVYDKIKGVLSSSDHAYCITCAPKEEIYDKNQYFRIMFTEGRCLFACEDVSIIEKYSDMKNEYGIAPCPKYDKAQESYLTLYGSDDALLAIPKDTEDINRTAAIIEDLNYQSSLTVTPVWFDSLMEKGKLKCEDSKNTLRLLKENQVYDIGVYYNFGELKTKVLDVDPVVNDVIEKYNMWEKVMKSDISKVVENMRKADGK